MNTLNSLGTEKISRYGQSAGEVFSQTGHIVTATTRTPEQQEGATPRSVGDTPTNQPTVANSI